MDGDGMGGGEGDIPHAGQQLNETTICKGQADNNVRLRDAAGVDVDERQHKGGQGEGAQAEGRWVGKLAVGGGPVETRLELSSKGAKSSRLAGVEVGERVPSVGALGGDAVLAIDAGGSLAVQLLIVVEGVVGGSGGGHGDGGGGGAGVGDMR